MRARRGGWLIASAVAVVACTGRAATFTLPSRSASDGDLAYLNSRYLLVPVDGVRAAAIPDSFGDARGGGRAHRAVDIAAPRGTPVRSADDGIVYKINSNAAGGLVVYALDPARRYVYYYAHLSRYSATLREGMSVAKGELLGYVGTTGNAPKNAPHLHFQIMRLDDPKRWWAGTPVNPLPRLHDRGRG
ncbi:MAG: hypothetical protein NVS9B3_13910 [Gemmatimonadaceae bacterium]